MRALVALRMPGRAGERFGRERPLAVRTGHLAARIRLNRVGHPSTLATAIRRGGYLTRGRRRRKLDAPLGPHPGHALRGPLTAGAKPSLCGRSPTRNPARPGMRAQASAALPQTRRPPPLSSPGEAGDGYLAGEPLVPPRAPSFRAGAWFSGWRSRRLDARCLWSPLRGEPLAGMNPASAGDACGLPSAPSFPGTPGSLAPPRPSLTSACARESAADRRPGAVPRRPRT